MRRVRAIDKPICPSCGGYVPNAEHAGEYPGAISRVDNATEICSECGSKEALMQLVGMALDKGDWWIARQKDKAGAIPMEFYADIDDMRRAELLD